MTRKATENEGNSRFSHFSPLQTKVFAVALALVLCGAGAVFAVSSIGNPVFSFAGETTTSQEEKEIELTVSESTDDETAFVYSDDDALNDKNGTIDSDEIINIKIDPASVDGISTTQTSEDLENEFIEGLIDDSINKSTTKSGIRSSSSSSFLIADTDNYYSALRNTASYSLLSSTQETQEASSDETVNISVAASNATSSGVDYGLTSLSGASLSIYNELTDSIENIAANGGDTSKIATNWTYTFTSTSTTSDDLYKEARDYLYANVEVEKLCFTLIYENPSALYWYDKTAGISIPSFTYSRDGNTITITKVNFSFEVSQDYYGSNFYVNADKASAATAAIKNAESIVSASERMGIEERIKYYFTTVCDLITYNAEVADDDDWPYGDPWQIVYVFDNDDSTQVVCEGYSKAIQYLCDLTWPSGSPVTCYSVSGKLYVDGSTNGAHMWNVIDVYGERFLLDATNYDSNASYLNGISTGWYLGRSLNGETYDSSTGVEIEIYNGKSGFYKYDDTTLAIYPTDGILNLSAEGTEFPTGPEELSISNCSLSSTSLSYTGSALEPAVTVKNSNGDTLTNGTDYMVSYSNNVNAGTATVTITGNGTDYTGTITTQFTITPAPITPTVTLSGSFFAYTGEAVEPGVIVSNGSTVLSDSEYSISYFNNVNMGIAAVTVTDNSNNYDFSDVTVSFNIVSSVVPTIEFSSGVDTYTYTGSAIEPSINVYIDGTLIPSSEYNVIYSNNIEIGTGKITISDNSSDYEFCDVVATFTIEATSSQTTNTENANANTADNTNANTNTNSNSNTESTGSNSNSENITSNNNSTATSTTNSNSNAAASTATSTATDNANNTDAQNTDTASTTISQTGDIAVAAGVIVAVVAAVIIIIVIVIKRKRDSNK